MERRLRLWSGLVLLTYVATHYLNHALGLVSLDWLVQGRLWFLAIWRNPIGTALLYPALVTHVALVLWALYQRRHLRLPRWEILRLVLGLLLPILLVPHIFGTRVLHDVYGVDDDYALVVSGMWLEHPESAIIQSTLLVIAWAHGCMGVHYWLRFRPWYPTAQPWLRAGALLLPVLGLLGFADAGKAFGVLAQQPGWLERVLAAVSEEQMNTVLGWGQITIGIFVLALVLTLGGRLVRDALQKRGGVVRLTYPDGHRITVARGLTVLEASRAAGIPHASVCGGRGRCSTCRSRIVGDETALPRPSASELRVLQRIGAPPDVRLACQLRPTADVSVFPLLPPGVQPAESLVRPIYTHGVEHEIAILFADIRSFTQLSEHRFPFDVVFLLNRYFAAMGRAVEEAGGRLDKFIGDGVMALFGVTDGPERGCRNALNAAVGMSRALKGLNADLAHDLTEPLRIGIGIHLGPAIVGEMGYGRATTLTAIGDAVNTASRLESMNKEFKSQLVVSEDVAARAGVDLSAFDAQEIEVRGRTTLLRVHIVPDARELAELLRLTPAAV